MSTFDSGNIPSPSPQADTPLKSTLAGDPDMGELVAFFVEDMSERITTIQTAAQENDLGRLRMVAHQLKGAGTGYGFAPITDCAGTLEQMIDHGDPSADIEGLRSQVDALIDLCRRASA